MFFSNISENMIFYIADKFVNNFFRIVRDRGSPPTPTGKCKILIAGFFEEGVEVKGNGKQSYSFSSRKFSIVRRKNMLSEKLPFRFILHMREVTFLAFVDIFKFFIFSHIPFFTIFNVNE